MRTEDGSIIYECMNGKPEAFGVLVDKYKTGIYAFVYAQLRNFQDAQDVTQEVFIQAYRDLCSLRRWESFAFWLYRIASTRCKKWLRARSRRPDRDFIEDQDPMILDKLSLDVYRNSQIDKSLRETLDLLPEAYREVLLLHYFGGMTSRDIGRALGTSPAAILQRLTRARSRLKEEIVGMMSKTFKQQGLPMTFTFRIVEMTKRMKIQPTPRTAGLPWGLSLAAGIILAILSLGSHMSLSHFMRPPMDSTFSDEITAAEAGEIPVDVLKFSRMPALSSKGDDDYGGGIMLPDQQNAVLLAPRGEGDEWPNEPAARLGKGVVVQTIYSPDGNLLAVGGALGVSLYNAGNLAEVGFLEEHTDMITSVAFRPDGELLAMGSSDRTVHLWDVEQQEQVGAFQGHTDSVYSAIFSPDGRLLASGSWDNTVRLWDVESRESVATLRGHTDMVWSVAFSPDGKLLASSGYDNTIRLWDVAEQKQIGVLRGHQNCVPFIAFSPDGKLLASVSWDNTVRLWDVDEQKQIGTLRGHTDWVYSVVFSPDGKLVASGGEDRTVRLWDVDGQKQVAVLKHTGYVNSITFSPDGKTLASGEEGTVYLWDVSEQKQVAMLEGYSSRAVGVAFSPSGELLASGNGDSTVRLWDIDAQKQIAMLEGHTGDWVQSVAFSPDGKLLASGGNDNTVRLWDVQEQKQVGMWNHKMAFSVAFSPDGETIASGGADKIIRFWDVDGQKPVGTLRGHTGWIYSVAFSPDGRLLASGGEGNIVRLWDIDKQKQIAELRGHTGAVSSVVFSPDGETLASGSYDSSIRLWSVNEQKEIAVLRGHTDRVWSIAFSPDGKTIASGGRREDSTVRLWSVDEQKQVAMLEEHKRSVLSVTFSKDGKWLASGSEDGTVLLWEVNIDVTGMSVEPMGKLPSTWGEAKRAALFQNFPNPFNPETWIPFRLSESKYVTIRIYTSGGRLVRTLKLGQKPAGAYLSKEKAAYWDGRNEAGELAASDIYFYAMEVGEHTELKKMAVAR